MFTVNDIRKEYKRLDQQLNLNTSNINIQISTKAVNRLGSCSTKNYTPVKITIADFVLKDENLFYDVIRHEYAHAITKIRYPREKHGHDYIWQRACREVGCSPTRCNDIESDILKTVKDEKSKYTVTCESCGKQYLYFRKANIIKAIESGNVKGFYCGKCNNRTFKLEYAI
jgi:predicted SprT family Zn-dependent metalloprotease